MNGERIRSIPCATTDWSGDAADHQPQPSLWDAILADACLGLPAELARVDTLLDAPRFLAPLAAHFDPRIGRPSVPLDTYLRIMFLKFCYRLGYELVYRERAVRSLGSGSAASHHPGSSSPAAWASPRSLH